MSSDLTTPGGGDDQRALPGLDLPAKRQGSSVRPPTPSLSRGRLVWQAAVFGLKLAVDGLKDLVLAPLAVGALVFDLLAADEQRGIFLRGVMHIGERFERWLNLYGERRRAAGILDDGGSDILVDYFESTAKEIHGTFRERKERPES